MLNTSEPIRPESVKAFDMRRSAERRIAAPTEVVGQAPGLSDAEFLQFQALLRQLAGIHLSPSKKALLCGRLNKRLRHYNLGSYGEYFRLLTSAEAPHELQIALDLLTTNETYFFRETKHFDFLRDKVLPQKKPGATFRIWSAACSSGEEPYSLAMLLSERLGVAPWEIVASDISTRVLERAHTGHYAMDRARHIPPEYLRAYCMKGVGKHDGTLLVAPSLREKVRFMQVNLNEALPRLGEFDVIFIRNVMIYFEMDTKRRVLQRLIPFLKPGAYLIVGHSESLNGVTEDLKPVSPSIYRRE